MAFIHTATTYPPPSHCQSAHHASAELARAMTGYTDDPALASPADQVQILGLWRALFHVWSNAHRQHLSDTLDPAIYASIVQEISTYAEPGAHANNVKDLTRRKLVMRWAWESERFIFNPDFQVFVDGRGHLSPSRPCATSRAKGLSAWCSG